MSAVVSTLPLQTGLEQAKPTGELPQVPPAHVMQGPPLQALLQQVPPTQLPLRHCVADVH
jgi:hypothetical protein